ncbi:hypothetical protein ACRRTK_011097 [Alexandromys fortis]
MSIWIPICEGSTWDGMRNKSWSQHRTSVTCFKTRTSILEVPEPYVHHHLVLFNSL